MGDRIAGPDLPIRRQSWPHQPSIEQRIRWGRYRDRQGRDWISAELGARQLSPREACAAQSIRQTFITPRRPGPNGTVERFNLTVTAGMAECI